MVRALWGIVVGARDAIRALDERTRVLRAANRLPRASLWTLGGAVLGDREARKVARAAPMEYVNRYRAVRILTEFRQDWRQGRALENLTRRGIIMLASRPKLARFAPGPY